MKKTGKFSTFIKCYTNMNNLLPNLVRLQFAISSDFEILSQASGLTLVAVHTTWDRKNIKT